MSDPLNLDWKNFSIKQHSSTEIFQNQIALINHLKFVGFDQKYRVAITDSGVTLIPSKDHEVIIASCEKYIKAIFLEPNYYLVNFFDSPRKQKSGFELEDRVSLFCLAVRLITGGFCSSCVSFYYENFDSGNKYYCPYVSKEGGIMDLEERDKSKIKFTEFPILQKIYNDLYRLKIFKNDNQFSRLKNALRFYYNIQDMGSFLEKTVFSFSLLESLFSDQSKVEIAYKVSLRVAFFLYPNNSTERYKIFTFLKSSYDLRSSYLHGSKVRRSKFENKIIKKSNKSENYSLMFDLPFDINQIISRVLFKILQKESFLNFFSVEQKEEVEELFFEKLVFSSGEEHLF